MDVLKLLEYNRWANHLLASQIETFTQEVFEKDLGGSFPSMRATIIHVLESDWLWLNRFNGVLPAEVPRWKTDDSRAITREWGRIQDEMFIVSKRMVQDLNKTIGFRTRKGQQLTMLLTDILTHISHHGSYHRGQLANMIRMSGEKPVGTDYFIFTLGNR